MLIVIIITIMSDLLDSTGPIFSHRLPLILNSCSEKLLLKMSLFHR